MLFFLSIAFAAFPNRNDALLSSHANTLKIDASGSLGLYHNGKCHPTYPNSTVIVAKEDDWCSNIAPSVNEKPWISYTFPGKSMKLTGYAIRNGCCYYACCCNPGTSEIDYRCCCALYQYHLQGSNDNKTWKTLHSVTKEDKYFYLCEFRSYDLPLTEAFNFIRIILVDPRPDCPFCLQINQVELYGELLSSSFETELDDSDEESISIIGKVKRE